MNYIFLVDKKDGGSTKQLLPKALGSTELKKPISIVIDRRVLEIASVVHKERFAREIVEKLFQSAWSARHGCHKKNPSQLEILFGFNV